MIKKIVGAFIAIVAIFLGVVATQPSTYLIQRSTEIKAPPGIIWPRVSNFHHWKAWNPWKEEDPTQKDTISGAPGTVGHSSSWVGEKTGEGAMTIEKIDRPSRIDMKLAFMKPMASEAKSAFELIPSGDITRLRWTMGGENDFMGKLFSLFMNMDEMIGSKYETGLAKIKVIAERDAEQQSRQAEESRKAHAAAEAAAQQAAIDAMNAADQAAGSQ